jgi:hypothetical protein
VSNGASDRRTIVVFSASSEDSFSDDGDQSLDYSKSPPFTSSKYEKSSSLSSSRRGEKPKPIRSKPGLKWKIPVLHQKMMKKRFRSIHGRLDQRMAMPELDNNDDDDDDMEAGLSSAKAPAEPSFLWGIMSKGLGSRQQDSNVAAKERKAAPLTRQARWTEAKPVEENYAVVGSSSVLGEDETSTR